MGLIRDNKTNNSNEHNLVKCLNLLEAVPPVGYLTSVAKDLNSGLVNVIMEISVSNLSVNPACG